MRGSAKERLLEIAHQDDEGLQEVRIACDFARHVDDIDAVVPGARVTILEEKKNAHLTPKNIARLAKRPETGINTAMATAVMGLHPFAQRPPLGIPEAQFTWHFDLDRLRKAEAILQRIEHLTVSPDSAPTDSDRNDLATHMTGIRVYTDALRLVLDDGKKCAATPSLKSSPSGSQKEFVRLAKKARGLIENVTGDFLRAAHTRPFDAVHNDLARAVRAVALRAVRIVDSLRPRVTSESPPSVDPMPDGPDKIGGTYVVVFQAEESNVVRVGKLGTFWIPSGFLLYVGSAFGGGGVLTRTSRHLNTGALLRWNVDHLKRIAHPVEVWWTHNDKQDRVECPWAMALASMRVCCCPVPGFGSNDCKRCPAHLYQTENRPSIRAFARQLGLNGSGGYSINRQLIR